MYFTHKLFKHGAVLVNQILQKLKWNKILLLIVFALICLFIFWIDNSLMEELKLARWSHENYVNYFNCSVSLIRHIIFFFSVKMFFCRNLVLDQGMSYSWLFPHTKLYQMTANLLTTTLKNKRDSLLAIGGSEKNWVCSKNNCLCVCEKKRVGF